MGPRTQVARHKTLTVTALCLHEHGMHHSYRNTAASLCSLTEDSRTIHDPAKWPPSEGPSTWTVDISPNHHPRTPNAPGNAVTPLSLQGRGVIQSAVTPCDRPNSGWRA